MTNDLILALPSKGRLQEKTVELFAQVGMKIERPGGSRDYRGRFKGLDGVQIQFLSASEIAGQIASGQVHLGVTGEDLIREEIGYENTLVHLITELGFGGANVVVAVPSAWIDVRNMADLNDIAADMMTSQGRHLRVATKYINLTRHYFAEQGLGDYRIVKSLGATEGAPAAGVAECIVDITSTGSTLAANHLRVLDDSPFLKSQANLAASLRKDWTEEQKLVLRKMLSRLNGCAMAKATQVLDVALDSENLTAATKALQDCVNKFGVDLLEGSPDSKRTRCSYLVPRSKAFAIVDELACHQLMTLMLRDSDVIVTGENKLYTEFEAALR